MGQPGFFDLDERYQRLSENGDSLVKLAALIDFEAFRPKLATALKRFDGSKGGRPPYDPVLMFKILVLQTLYTLSDDATEFRSAPFGSDPGSALVHALPRSRLRGWSARRQDGVAVPGAPDPGPAQSRSCLPPSTPG